MKVFDSKYPIIAAPMNQVSDLNLALAVFDAGGIPSISGYCYNSIEQIIDAFESFVKISGSNNIIAALDDKIICNIKIFKMLNLLKIKYIIRYNTEDNASLSEDIKKFENRSKFLIKNLSSVLIDIHHNIDQNNINLKNLYYLKGLDGAGRPGKFTTKELFFKYKNKFSNSLLIPVGGIGSPEQVKEYIDNGAVAVGIGTLLAASKESCLSEGTKKELIRNSSQALKIIDSNNKQQGLVFEKLDINDDTNNTNNLIEGIKSNGNKGLIFAGQGIDYINEIKPVKQILEELCSLISYS